MSTNSTSRYKSIIIITLLALLLIRYTSPTLNREVVSERIEVLYDTIRHFQIEPIEVTPIIQERAENINETEYTREMIEPMLYHYCDTLDGLWSMDIVGRDVELRSLEIINRAEHHHTVSYTPPRWEVRLYSGINLHSSWVGVGVERNFGALRLSLCSGYDPLQRAPHIEARASIRLFNIK